MAIAFDSVGNPGNVPQLGSQSNGTATSISTPSFSTSAGVILVAVSSWAGGASAGGNLAPLSIGAISGVSWTKVLENDCTGNTAPCAAVWVGTLTGGALSSVAVTVSRGGSSTTGISTSLAVYVLTGASGFGNSGGKNIAGSFTNIDATITPSGAGSWLPAKSSSRPPPTTAASAPTSPSARRCPPARPSFSTSDKEPIRVVSVERHLSEALKAIMAEHGLVEKA